MKKKSTFKKGGIHPPEHKKLTNTKAIQNAALPRIAVVPMSQHIGSPAECVVAKGHHVKEETLIGKSTGFVSAQIHSPIPGVVEDIKEIYLPNGAKTQAVVIALEGEFDRTGKAEQKNDWKYQTPNNLLDIIADKGIVGLGGATFPAHVKFSIPKGKQAKYFIVNGTECEPYLSADHRLMVEKTDEIIEGLEIVQKILNVEEIIIGIEVNKPDAIEILEKAAEKSQLPIRVQPLKLKYPQGDEKQLMAACIGIEIPSGLLPVDIGCVVANVGTIFSIYEAVVLEKPVIERIVTVSGGAIKNPGNLKVRVGTSIGDVIDECGGFTQVPDKIIVGGPMMGFAVHDLDTPVTKGTSGILALTRGEVKASWQTPCIQCGRCIQACPMGLNPTRLFKWIDHQETDNAVDEGLMDCKECGCCGFMCPAHIPLIQGMRLGKRIVRNKKVKK